VQLRRTVADEFEGGEAERSRVLEEAERDYIALVSAGAEAARLEAALALADRRATDRESDLAAPSGCPAPWDSTLVAISRAGCRRGLGLGLDALAVVEMPVLRTVLGWRGGAEGKRCDQRDEPGGGTASAMYH
jgi:hypothetical protein